MKDIHALLMDESFQHWLSGEATLEEKRHWEKWLKESPHASSLYKQAQNLWDITQYREVDVPNIDTEWDKLKTTLHPCEEPVRPVRFSFFNYAKFLKLRTGANKYRWKKTGALAFISIVILGLLMGKYIIRPSSQELTQVISTNYGQRNILTFLDGTRIILNANSRLEYPLEWKAKTEKRVILEGEAFFEVADMSLNPQGKFIVQTEDGIVKVVGTKFAVHRRGNETRVAVEKGEVEVSLMRPTTAGSGHVIIHPNQLLVFQKESRELIPSDVNIKPYTTWWQEKYILDRTPFREIVDRIEDTYGVSVIVQKPELLDRTLSGSFGNENLTVITSAIGKALDVKVQWEKNMVIFGS